MIVIIKSFIMNIIPLNSFSKIHSKKLLPYFIILFATFVCHYGILKSEFIGDDIGRIIYSRSYFDTGLSTAMTEGMQDRPVLMAIMFLNYTLDGLNPFFYKLSSVILHLLLCLLLFSFFSHFQKHYLNKSNITFPLFCTLIFCVHPTNAQAIMSSIQVGIIISAIGIIGALLYYSKYLLDKKRIFYYISILFFTFGILAKPNIVTLPLMLMLFLLCNRQLTPKRFLTIIPYVLLCFVPFAFYFFAKINTQVNTLDWYHYLLVQFRVIFYYLKLFIIPANLHFSYELETNYAFYSYKMWLALFGHIAIGGLTFYLSKSLKYLWPVVALFYLALIPESSFFPIQDVIFEHRTYVPYLFLCLIFLIVFNHYKFFEKKYFYFIASISIIGLALTTHARIKSVDTYEKWSINDYQYKTPSEKNKLNLLNNLVVDLYFKVDKDTGVAKTIAMQFAAANPRNQLYPIYVNIFSYKLLSQAQKKETLETIGNILRSDKIILLENTRSHFLTFLYQNLGDFIQERFLYLKMLEPILQKQILYFTRYPDVYHEHKAFQTTLLLELKSYFERSAIKKPLMSDDLDQYLVVLEQLAYFYPGDAKIFYKNIDALEKNYSEYKDYFAKIRKKYF